MQEPSVLDYVKSKLMPWKYPPVQIPEAGEPRQPVLAELVIEVPPAAAEPVQEPAAAEEPPAPAAPRRMLSWPWQGLVALALAMVGQRAFAPPERSPRLGIILLLLAAAWTIYAYLRDNWQPADYPPPAGPAEAKEAPTLRSPALVVGVGLACAAFLASGNNQVSWFTLVALLLSLACLAWAVLPAAPPWQDWLQRISAFFSRKSWNLSMARWGLLVLAACGLVLFFRFYRLDQVPSEMVSDHAEKLLDVADVLNGQTRIFFPRNGGREALQFYLLAGLHRYFGAPLDHLTLKFSTTLIGLLALPFLYFLGKELGSRRLGLLAFTLAGISYWTNVVSRAGMRLPFYFLFTAATCYFLVRGLRTLRTSDFILTGITLGLSLYGYSADRILPLVVVAAVGLFLVHRQSAGKRQQTLWLAAVMALFALVVFLPLLRYITQEPDAFGYRMFSRMGTAEQPLPGPALQIFLDNLWRAVIMFSWSDGVVWGVSIPDYPALGVVSGALFYLGATLALVRYIRKQHWLDLFLLGSIPLLMLPSIMALAFPSENPNLYRTGGAMVPVFLLAALALDGLMTALENKLGAPGGRRAAWVLAIVLVGLAAVQDYDWVFNRYNQQYRLSAWNTSEMGHMIREFGDTIGTPDSAWVMGYPYWVDTRLVGINAGYPGKDYAMFADQLNTTLANPNAKLFILNPLDTTGLQALQSLYPQGWLKPFKSVYESKDFLVYFVPPSH